MFCSKKFFLYFLLINFTNNIINKSFTIMISPAGDAKDAGRMLSNSFERGITLQFALEVKKIIEITYPNIRVVLSRVPGESLENLQNANFANRLDIDFYLSVHFYKATEAVPQLFLFYYLQDIFYAPFLLNLNFYDFDNAYLINIKKTLNYIDKFKNSLKKKLSKNLYNFQGALGIPFKPLLGIIAPAIAIEIGLKNANDFNNYIIPIVETLGDTINEQ